MSSPTTSVTFKATNNAVNAMNSPDPFNDNTQGGSDDAHVKFAWHSSVGLDLQRRARYQQAIEAYSRALEFHPTDINTYWNRAECNILMGDLPQAAKDGETIAKIEAGKGIPGLHRGLLMQGNVLFAEGRFEEACMFFHRGNQMRPDVVEFMKGVSKCEEAMLGAVAPDRHDKITIATPTFGDNALAVDGGPVRPQTSFAVSQLTGSAFFRAPHRPQSAGVSRIVPSSATTTTTTSKKLPVSRPTSAKTEAAIVTVRKPPLSSSPFERPGTRSTMVVERPKTASSSRPPTAMYRAQIPQSSSSLEARQANEQVYQQYQKCMPEFAVDVAFLDEISRSNLYQNDKPNLNNVYDAQVFRTNHNHPANANIYLGAKKKKVDSEDVKRKKREKKTKKAGGEHRALGASSDWTDEDLERLIEAATAEAGETTGGPYHLVEQSGVQQHPSRRRGRKNAVISSSEPNHSISVERRRRSTVTGGPLLRSPSLSPNGLNASSVSVLEGPIKEEESNGGGENNNKSTEGPSTQQIQQLHLLKKKVQDAENIESNMCAAFHQYDHLSPRRRGGNSTHSLRHIPASSINIPFASCAAAVSKAPNEDMQQALHQVLGYLEKRKMFWLHNDTIIKFPPAVPDSAFRPVSQMSLSSVERKGLLGGRSPKKQKGKSTHRARNSTAQDSNNPSATNSPALSPMTSPQQAALNPKVQQFSVGLSEMGVVNAAVVPVVSKSSHLEDIDEDEQFTEKQQKRRRNENEIERNHYMQSTAISRKREEQSVAYLQMVKEELMDNQKKQGALRRRLQQSVQLQHCNRHDPTPVFSGGAQTTKERTIVHHQKQEVDQKKRKPEEQPKTKNTHTLASHFSPIFQFQNAQEAASATNPRWLEEEEEEQEENEKAARREMARRVQGGRIFGPPHQPHAEWIDKSDDDDEDEPFIFEDQEDANERRNNRKPQPMFDTQSESEGSPLHRQHKRLKNQHEKGGESHGFGSTRHVEKQERRRGEERYDLQKNGKKNKTLLPPCEMLQQGISVELNWGHFGGEEDRNEQDSMSVEEGESRDENPPQWQLHQKQQRSHRRALLKERHQKERNRLLQTIKDQMNTGLPYEQALRYGKNVLNMPSGATFVSEGDQGAAVVVPTFVSMSGEQRADSTNSAAVGQKTAKFPPRRQFNPFAAKYQPKTAAAGVMLERQKQREKQQKLEKQRAEEEFQQNLFSKQGRGILQIDRGDEDAESMSATSAASSITPYNRHRKKGQTEEQAQFSAEQIRKQRMKLIHDLHTLQELIAVNAFPDVIRLINNLLWELRYYSDDVLRGMSHALEGGSFQNIQRKDTEEGKNSTSCKKNAVTTKFSLSEVLEAQLRYLLGTVYSGVEEWKLAVQEFSKAALKAGKCGRMDLHTSCVAKLSHVYAYGDDTVLKAMDERAARGGGKGNNDFDGENFDEDDDISLQRGGVFHDDADYEGGGGFDSENDQEGYLLNHTNAHQHQQQQGNLDEGDPDMVGDYSHPPVPLSLDKAQMYLSMRNLNEALQKQQQDEGQSSPRFGGV